MITAVIIYLSVGLIISILARGLLGGNYPYSHEPWVTHTAVIFLWLPAVVAAMIDKWRRR